MKREILFRGKTYDGHWIYGNLLVKGSFCYIIGTDDSKAVEVIPESVGQYTGLKDCKGNKIFEGDILQCKGMTENTLGKVDNFYVYYYNGSYFLKFANCFFDKTCYSKYPLYFAEMEAEIEVIGNTTDNKDLLTKQTEQ